MTIWEERPVEVANLFNPAFCGEIIRLCAKSYFSESKQAFPYALSFLVLPIVLYDNTRNTIVARNYKYLHTWIQDNLYLRVNFAQRVCEFVPIAKEAIIFLLQIGALELNDEAGLLVQKYRRKTVQNQKEKPITDYYEKAEVLGRWLARAGDVTTVYVMWGIKP